MNRTRWLLAGISVAGCIIFVLSVNWVVGKLMPQDHPGRMAYKPYDDIPPVDMASVQRGWPNNLERPGERKRLVTYLHDTKGTAPAAVSQAGPKEPDVPPDLGTLLVSAVASEGEAKARACISCHGFTAGGPDRIGPNLWGVVGRDIAANQGFSYSSAMQSYPGEWTYQHLFDFLASPGRFVSGTKMSYAGMRRPEDRAALIKYLATLGGNPPPFPQPQPPAQPETAALAE